MQTQNHSMKFLKKRKFLTVLPLLITPFLTMAFWALGGGRGTNEADKGLNKKQGINLQLPIAKLKDDKEQDKLSFYNKAQKDSLAFEDAVKNDPYYRKYVAEDEAYINDSVDDNALTEFETIDKKEKHRNSVGLNTSPKYGNGYTDPNEKRVRAKLDELKKAMSAQESSNNKIIKPYNNYSTSINHDEFTNQVDKLQGLMQAMNTGDEADPEMQQLENMMDKIMDIQHPERVKEKIEKQSKENEKSLFSVSGAAKINDISLLQSPYDKIPDKSNNKNAFFGLDAGVELSADTINTLRAIIHETQTIVNGGTVKMRLVQDAYINSIKIPNGNFIYGTASLNNERLKVEINSIRFGNSLYPVKLKAFDLDGLEGIYIPDAIGSELAKQSSDNALQNISMMSVDPTLTEQAASAGINAAKTIFSKKVKLVKVTLKAGYQVLLKN
ncbi:MAG TPA: conjugative transposon protein TraM [Panacibacter sp.]|nr:conjugative transposon protein TraM [Panacibacter sp.]